MLVFYLSFSAQAWIYFCNVMNCWAAIQTDFDLGILVQDWRWRHNSLMLPLQSCRSCLGNFSGWLIRASVISHFSSVITIIARSKERQEKKEKDLKNYITISHHALSWHYPSYNDEMIPSCRESCLAVHFRTRFVQKILASKMCHLCPYKFYSATASPFISGSIFQAEIKHAPCFKDFAIKR